MFGTTIKRNYWKNLLSINYPEMSKEKRYRIEFHWSNDHHIKSICFVSLCMQQIDRVTCSYLNDLYIIWYIFMALYIFFMQFYTRVSSKTKPSTRHLSGDEHWSIKCSLKGCVRKYKQIYVLIWWRELNTNKWNCK